MNTLANDADRRADRIVAVVLTAFLTALSAGGAAVLSSVSNASADDASWSPCQTMVYPRAWPGAVELPSGDILVVDSGNNRVQRFRADGTFLAAFGRGGSAIGELDSPSGILALDSGGFIVADSNNDRLQLFLPPD